MPVVAMHHVWRKTHVLAGDQGSPAKCQKTPVFIAFTRVNRTAVVKLRAVHKVSQRVGLVAQNLDPVVVTAQLHIEAFDHAGQAEAVATDRVVQRQEHAHVVAGRGQVARQRADDICQTAGLGVRHHLG